MSTEIRTATGVHFDVINPRHEDVNILDIAIALSRIQRYGGHYPVSNSVAAHSIRVATAVADEHKLDALLHDASEAYLGDVVRPLKHAWEMDGYVTIESRVQQVVAEALGTSWPIPKAVHAADRTDSDIEQYLWKYGPDRVNLQDCTAGDFLRVYHDLTGLNHYDEWVCLTGGR